MKLLTTALALVLFAGCATVKEMPLAAESRPTLKGKSLQPTKYETTQLISMTAGKAAVGGLIGAAMMVNKGKELTQQFGLIDPAAYVAESIATRMSQEFGVTPLPLPTDPVVDKENLVTRFPDADLILDVRTVSWGYIYFPGHWSRYRLMCNFRMRLLDAATQSLLAEGFYQYLPEFTESAPTIEELKANDGQWIKDEAIHAADAAIVHFMNTIFFTPPSE